MDYRSLAFIASSLSSFLLGYLLGKSDNSRPRY